MDWLDFSLSPYRCLRRMRMLKSGSDRQCTLSTICSVLFQRLLSGCWSHMFWQGHICGHFWVDILLSLLVTVHLRRVFSSPLGWRKFLSSVDSCLFILPASRAWKCKPCCESVLLGVSVTGRQSSLVSSRLICYSEFRLASSLLSTTLLSILSPSSPIFGLSGASMQQFCTRRWCDISRILRYVLCRGMSAGQTVTKLFSREAWKYNFFQYFHLIW